ncbi:bacteriohemerythrin [Telmatobacter bradus]|uniref:bacteriohemerythrin n=1 Tax=Telmatobacter bradus TaxID=474953 RepID=UPI003B439907
MALMEWNDRLSVGIMVLDEDHKKLVAMINELFDNIMAENSKEKLGAVLNKLIQYTVEHFKREEAFFARTNYPLAAEHIKEHQKLTEQVLKVQSDFEKNIDATLSLHVMNFLRQWLTKHIQGEDHKYTAHLNANGIH